MASKMKMIMLKTRGKVDIIIPATVVGPFAVHRCIEVSDGVPRLMNKGWTISHIASGLAVADVQGGMGYAMQLAQLIAEKDADWYSKDPTVGHPNVRQEVEDVINDLRHSRQMTTRKK